MGVSLLDEERHQNIPGIGNSKCDGCEAGERVASLNNWQQSSRHEGQESSPLGEYFPVGEEDMFYILPF